MISIKLSSELQIGQWVTASSHKDLFCIENEEILQAARKDFDTGSLMEGYWNTKVEALKEMLGWWKGNKNELAIIKKMISNDYADQYDKANWN